MGLLEEMLDEEDKKSKKVDVDVGKELSNDFDKMLDEFGAEEYRGQMDEMVVDVGFDEEKSSKVSKSVSYQVRKARRLDEKTKDVMSLVGVDWTMRFAHELHASRQMFDSRSLAKPRWCVVGCVLIRDQGKCKVCGSKLNNKWEVVQLIPAHAGGTFNELNCVTICSECGICWNKNKNFYTGLGEKVSWRRQRLYVMRRRNTNYHDCCPLGVEGLEIQRKLVVEEERYRLMVKDEGKELERLVEKRKESLRDIIKGLGKEMVEKDKSFSFIKKVED